MIRSVVPLLFLLGCSAPQPGLRQVRVIQEVEAALDAQEGAVVLRYNPPSCKCPAFEVNAAGRWIRAEVRSDGDEQPLDALLAKAVEDRGAGKVATYHVTVSLDSARPDFCFNGTPYVELRLEPSE